MKNTKTICNGMEERLAEMLLAPDAVSASVREHVAGCPACRGELAELRATLGMLDQWQAPEPNPFFLTRLEAGLREARQEPRRGWLGRLRDRMQFGPEPHLQPVAAMALTIAMLVGGGAYLGVTNWVQPQAKPDQTAAVVHELQTMDSNAQVLDQLEQISSNDEKQQQP